VACPQVSDAEDDLARCALGVVLMGGRGQARGQRIVAPAVGAQAGGGKHSVCVRPCPQKVTILLPLDMLAALKSLKFENKAELRKFAQPKVQSARGSPLPIVLLKMLRNCTREHGAGESPHVTCLLHSLWFRVLSSLLECAPFPLPLPVL